LKPFVKYSARRFKPATILQPDNDPDRTAGELDTQIAHPRKNEAHNRGENNIKRWPRITACAGFTFYVATSMFAQDNEVLANRAGSASPIPNGGKGTWSSKPKTLFR
jgi:hypothetical protein